jgi:hypothetical protein
LNWLLLLLLLCWHCSMMGVDGGSGIEMENKLATPQVHASVFTGLSFWCYY